MNTLQMKVVIKVIYFEDVKWKHENALLHQKSRKYFGSEFLNVKIFQRKLSRQALLALFGCSLDK